VIRSREYGDTSALCIFSHYVVFVKSASKSTQG
jgi:hypothetical protein